jgi:hypothetical protein
MNISKDPGKPSNVAQLIVEALDALRESTGITAQFLPQSDHAANRVSLDVAGKTLLYDCEVKQKVDRFLTLQDMKARAISNRETVLICAPLTSALAARCHDLDIQFIDTAGNAYITDKAGVLISVTGRTLAKASRDARDATITPAALRMIFGFLAEPSLLNAPYRDISMAVQVSTGAISKAFEALEIRGFIGTTPNGTRLLRSPELLLSEWATGYMHRIKPKLKQFRFTAPNPVDLLKKWNPGFKVSAWGGEVAAELITKHLNPSTFTIYLDMNHADELTDLVKRFRLRADPQGVIEVVQPFWNMGDFAYSFPTVPLHLVYADLLGTHDSRNLKVAEQIFHEAIDHVHNSQR